MWRCVASVWRIGAAFTFLMIGITAGYKSLEAEEAVKTGNTAGGGSVVVFKDGRLTVSARNSELIAVLKEIGKKAGFEVTAGPLSKETLTIAFEGLSLEAGLRKVLKNQNYYLLYSDTTLKAGSTVRTGDVAKVVILGKGQKGETGEKQGRQAGSPPLSRSDAGDAPGVVQEIIGELLHDDPQVQSRGLSRLGQSIETMRSVDPELIGALRLVLAEETRKSGLASLREIFKSSEGRGDAVPRN
ncbi:MAG: hypothetical protein C4582_10085 [Desulfobacteraceae bacterium]|nr:MAG: hypothetical protein C4582_10085 [Desulfobacteraceae bacterium]